MKVSSYTKAIVALLGAISTWGVTAAQDGSINLGEYFAGIGAIATALGVYYFPNSTVTSTEEAPVGSSDKVVPND